MDPLAFFAASRLVIVAGKGGVGKTTVTAALARRLQPSRACACSSSRSRARAGWAACSGAGRSRYDEVACSGRGGRRDRARSRARTLTPDDALLEYLEDHGLRRLSNRLVRGGALDVVATAAPGIKDILVLGQGQAARARRRSPTSSCSTPRPPATPSRSCSRPAGCSTRCASGPINTQAATSSSCSPTRRAARSARDAARGDPGERAGRDGLHAGGPRRREPRARRGQRPLPGTARLDADPVEAAEAARSALHAGRGRRAAAAAASFRASALALQREQVARLADRLPLPQIHLPFVFSTDLGPRRGRTCWPTPRSPSIADARGDAVTRRADA